MHADTHRRSLRPIRSVLRQQEQVQNVLQRAKVLRQISESLHKILPSYAKEHCQAGSLEDTQLVLVADSPAWATKLRYSLPSLKKHLIDDYLIAPNCAIRIKVIPYIEQMSSSTLPKPKPLTQDNAALLKETAANIEEGVLKQALLRLAGRVC